MSLPMAETEAMCKAILIFKTPKHKGFKISTFGHWGIHVQPWKGHPVIKVKYRDEKLKSWHIQCGFDDFYYTCGIRALIKIGSLLERKKEK